MREGYMPWFGRKRYGWGLRPISWQGWLLTVAYLALMFAAGLTLAQGQGWLFAAVFVVATAIYLLIAYLTRE
jgi:hypothetical protein